MKYRRLVCCIISALCISAASGPGLAASPGSWLDKKPLPVWNTAGAAIERSPKASSENLASCASNIRKASSAEDRRVSAAGWKLVGAHQQFGAASIVQAAAGFDGMCRWAGYQAFAFVNGVFAGTLAPHPMDSRTDGALDDIHLYSAANLVGEFTRYTDSDPLCCPSRTSTVTYAFARRPRGPIVTATEVTSTSTH